MEKFDVNISEITSTDDLNKIFDSFGNDKQKISDLYCLGHFWRNCIFNQNYSASRETTDNIVFTEFGNKLVQECVLTKKTSEADVKLALFMEFYWHNIFIDFKNTNLNGILQALSNELLSNKLRLPYIWGRLLHDRFHDNINLCKKDQLTHLNGWNLLDDCPIGVFQSGYFVSGPLGLIKVGYHRLFPVSKLIEYIRIIKNREIPHIIELDKGINDVTSSKAWFESHLVESYGEASNHWGELLIWHGSNQPQFGRCEDYFDVLPTIANCILDNDRILLFKSILESSSNSEIINTIKSTQKSSLARKSNNEICCNLTDIEVFQILHCISDKTLANHIDRLVLSKKIQIPSSEMRRSILKPPTRGVSFSSEISSIGIRPGILNPFAALCSTIQQAYASTDPTELEWRLKIDSNNNQHLSLTEYIRTFGLSLSVKELILTSRPVTNKICEMLGIPEVGSRDDATINRLLWKLGFEIPRHDDLLDRFDNELTNFEVFLQNVDWSLGEETRKKVRSEAVNLFVTVEEFLDRVISYNVWLLASDHKKVTRFEYLLSEARAKVAEVLGYSKGPDGKDVSWNINGENTLGPLLSYFSLFERWLDRLDQNISFPNVNNDFDNRDIYGRPSPYRSPYLWADSDAGELNKYKNHLKSFNSSLLAAEIAGVRNAIPHFKELNKFPTKAKFELCTSNLKKALKIAMETRIYPVTYWLDESRQKISGSTEYIFKAHDNSKFSLFRPSTVSSMPSISPMVPIIIAPVNFLGFADGILHFTQMGESNYSKYWANYPRHAKSTDEIVDSLFRYEEITRENSNSDGELTTSGSIENLPQLE
jgi:hypothetical protein